MHPVDCDGLMKVEVNGKVHRRPATVVVAGRYLDGTVALYHAVPDLRQGEVLVEILGRMPMIIQSGH